ncbi:MAG: AraC-like DNA-binding protein [Halieaceae bacterium]|jgi:AraC-like DNA-binding protein
MLSHFQVSSAYARLVLGAKWLPSTVLLAGSGMNEEQLKTVDFVSADTLMCIYRNLEDSGVEKAWTAHLGSRLNIATHGPLGFAALSAPTLGEALAVMANYHAVRVTGIRTEIRETEHRFELGIWDLTGDKDFARWMSEIILKVIETLIETILGHPVGGNVQAHFAHAAPSYAVELKNIYHSECRFGCEYSAISLPGSWRKLPSPLSSEEIYQSNIIKCKDTIASQISVKDTAARVRHIFNLHFDRKIAGETTKARPPDLNELALLIHATPRTLIRRLKRQQTSYRELLESARREYAENLLRQVRLSVADVAELLGYREAANFGRAFRRWYGTSPAAWRRTT